MRILRLSFLLLLCGCASQHDSDAAALDLKPMSARWRECSWEEIADWLASDSDCRRNDGAFGYECFTATSAVGRCIWGAKAWFSPYEAEGLTILCQNWTSDMLPIKGFPECCKGVNLSGPFDMSNVTMRDSVEGFRSEATGVSDLPQYHEAYNDLPRFTATSNLRSLSITRYGSRDDDCRTRRRIPCLDMTRFSEIGTLESVDVVVEGLALHAEKLLANNKLQYLSIHEFYGYLVDSDEQGTGADSGSEGASGDGSLQHYVVDDASFDEFVKRDFRGFKRMRVEIELSQVKTWDIARLANLPMDGLIISAENCMITGVEAFRDGLGANWLSIDMNISRDGDGTDLQ